MEDQELQETLEAVEPEQQEAAEEQVQEQAQAPRKNANEDNIRQMRQKAEERDYYYQKVQEMEQQKNQQRAPVQEEEESEPNPDDLVEWKQVKKRFNKLEKKIEAYEQQSSTSNAESRVRIKYPDFEQVVNKDTIAALREQYPDLAYTVSATNDLYAKASAAYTLIKKLNIAPDTEFETDRNRVQANASKPRPLASVSPQRGESPLTQANAFAGGLTKDQLYHQMMEAKKNYR